MNAFLTELSFVHERLNNGVDFHASDAQYTEFKRLADIISPHNNFEWRGCHSCGQHLMKFVFDNAHKLEVKTIEDGETEGN
jgi:hypothetical protein